MMQFDASQRISAFSGVVLIVLIQIESEELVKTVVLAGVGGISSYLFTLLVKFLISFYKKKF